MTEPEDYRSAILSNRSWRVIIDALTNQAEAEEDPAVAESYRVLATDLHKYVAPFT